MEKVKFVLSIWTKLASHIRMRDRSVKILQYGCQMLLGFYASKFSAEVVECLKLTKSAASTSRKAFWLFKSVNHIGAVIDLLESYDYTKDEGFAIFFDILEQLSLIVYYWYENLVFFSRTKLITTSESTLDRWGNPSWFFEDFTCFIAAFIRTVIKFKHTREKYMKMKLAEGTSRNIDADSLVVKRRGVSTDSSFVSVQSSDTLLLKREFEALQRQFGDNVLSLCIAFFEVAASAEAIHAWKPILGYDIGDQGMGLCGVVSSSLILFEGCIHAVRDASSLPEDEIDSSEPIPTHQSGT